MAIREFDGDLDATAVREFTGELDQIDELGSPEKPVAEMRATDVPWYEEYVTDPLKRGWVRGKQGISVAAHDLIGSAPTEERAVYMADLERQRQRYGASLEDEEAARKVMQSKGVGEFLSAIAKNPQVATNVTLESLGMFAPTLAATGVVSSVGTPAATSIAAGTGSAAVEYAQTMVSTIEESGMDPRDPRAWKKALSDEGLLSKARESGSKRGLAVGTFDGLTAGLAGKFLAGAKPGIVSPVARAGGELGLQATGGMAGEATAQVADKGEITSLGDVLMEGIAEMPTAVVEAPANIRQARETAKRTARPADPIDAAIEDANAIVDSAQTGPIVDPFAEQVAQQNVARQAEIDAAMPDAGPTIQMRPSARNEVYPTGPVRVPWLDTPATAEKPATINERGEFEFAPTKPAATSPEAPFAYEGAVDFKAPDLTTEPGAAPEATANQAEPGIPYAPNLSVETSRDASRRIARDERIQEQQKALGDVALPDGLKDPRLKRLDYRKALGDMSRQLVKGGDVTYVRDENDRITGRTGSINPDWFKALGEDKSTAMPVEDVKKAVNKALMGGKLGVREQRVISAMLNAHSGLRTSGPNIDYAKAQLDAAREGRRQSTGIFTPDAGEILLEDEYASDWSAEARILQELILEAEAVNPGTTYSIVERMAINGASTQEIMEALDQIITGEGNAKEAEQRSAVGAQEAPGGQEGGPRTAQTFGDGRGVPGPQSANPDEGARAEVGEVDRIPPAPRGEPGAPGAPVDAQGANDLSDRRQAAEPVAVAADQRQGERRSSGKARALYEQMSKDELIRALLHHELTGIKGKRSFVVEVEDAENVISIDADSLKWVNDNMSPDSGDRLLHATADALVEEFGYERAYHTSGDEFYVLLSPGESLDEAKAAMDRVEARVKATVIELTLKDGTYKSVTGITATPGYGTTKNEADYDLKARKTEREASGQRAARGERPAGAVVRPAPGGMQGDEGNASADAAPDVRREVSPQVASQQAPDNAGASDPATRNAFEDIQRKIKEREQRVADFASRHDGVTFSAPLSKLAHRNAYAIVSPSAHTPGKWQGTVFDSNGPSSDIVRDTQKAVISELVTDYGLDLDKATLSDEAAKTGAPHATDFSDMVREAARWKGAALNVARTLEGDKKAALQHSKATTKGDLDAYLMRKFGIDETTARDVSNELTRMNIPADETATASDFPNETWTKKADARKAASILDAANVRGDSRLNAIEKFRAGTFTLKDLEEAFPPAKTDISEAAKQPEAAPDKGAEADNLGDIPQEVESAQDTEQQGGSQDRAVNAARANPRRLADEEIYRASSPVKAGLPTEEVERVAANVALSWGENAREVIVHESLADAPQWMRDQVPPGDERTIQGFHDPTTGNVHLIAENLPNKSDVHRILGHEMAGHSAMEEVVNKGEVIKGGWTAVERRVDWLVKAGNKQARSLRDEVQRRGYNMADRATVTKEMLAVAVERHITDGPIGQILRQLRAAIRNLLRKAGINSLMPDADIDALVVRSLRFLKESGGRSKAVTEALEHPQLGEIDVALGKGRMGASKFATENPEVAANLEDLVASAKVISRDAESAVLESGGVTFDLVKKAGRWVLTDARVDFARSPFTETEAFRKWFGDSKVVDAEGKPLVVYHGTRADFESPNTKGERVPGFWVTPRKDVANAYAADGVVDARIYREGANVMPMYVSVKSPRTFDPRKESLQKAWGDYASGNFDGFIELDRDGSLYAVSVKNPEQIKSATGNRGTFDPSDARINFARSRTVGVSNRTYTADQQAAFEKTGRTVSEPTWKERVAEMTDGWSMKLRQGIADQFAPIADLDPKAYILSRLSKASDGALEAFMLHGQLKLTDGVYDADMSGGVIDKLLKPLQGEMDDFMWWVAANRAERLMGEGKERLFTPEDIAAYKSLASGQANFDYTLQHNTGPHKAGHVTRDRSLIYRDAAKTLEELNKNVMDMAEQSGLIDADNRKAWEQEFYIPFYRAMEDGIGGPNIKSGLVRQYAFKKLKGGKEKLNADLLANTIQNWAHLLSASAKNRAAEATLKAAEKIGAATPLPYGAPKPKKGTVQFLGYSERTIPKGQKYTEGGVEKVSDGTVIIREHGEIHYAVDDPFLLDAVTALEFNGFGGPVMKVAGKFKHYLTVGVTANPTFKVRNLIRDSISAIGVSRDLEANPLKNLKQGYKATSKESQTYVSMLASGGIIKFGTMLEGNRTDHVRALVDKGVDASTILDSEHKVKAFWRRYIKPAVDAYNDLGDRGESINRAALYEQMIANGMSHAEASLAARDLLDFSMGGTWTAVRLLTQVLPFANARVQGLYKLGRSDKKRLGYVVGSVSLASLALLAAYGDDDDWKQREDWDRDSYWWFKFGGVAFRIPKPFEIGAIGTLAERSAELFFDNEMTGQRYMERVGHLVGDQLAMNPIPQVVKPILDVYANKDSFTGRPIETMGMDRLMPEDRYTGKTSEIAKVIGQAGLLSPVQADHLIRGYFGWLGTATTTGVDLLARSTVVDEPPRPAMKLRDVFLAGNFVETLPANGSRYVSQMYDQSKEIEQAWASFQHYRKLGDMEKAQRIFDENRDKIGRFKLITKVKEMEANINRKIRQVEADRLMDSEVKRDLLDKLYRQRDMIARKMAARSG